MEFEDGTTGKIDYTNGTITVDPITIVFGVGLGDMTIKNNNIGAIKFEGLLPSDLTVSYGNNNAILTIISTGETLTIENFDIFAESQQTTLAFADGTEMQLDSEGSPFLNVVGTDSDDEITAFFANSTLFGGLGNDTYSFNSGFGSNIIKDTFGENTVKFTDINSDAVSFEITDDGELIITVAESGDVLTVREFNSENFKFEFADEISGTFNAETGEFERIPSDDEIAETDSVPTADELAQANADILDEIYANEDSMSDLLTESDNTVIPEITDSASAADEEENTNDLIDVQVMKLTENMAAFANESNISDNVNIQDNANDFAFANQLLVGTQAS